MTDVMGNGHPFSWPIAEFAHSIGAKHVAMLVGYFDDSGTHDRSSVCLLAGVISNSVYWGRIEQEWAARLLTRRAQGITWFHAFDCEHGHNEFKDIRRDLREPFAYGLSNVLCNHSYGVQCIASAVKRKDWDDCAPDFLKVRCLNDPYNFCFEHCLQQVANWSIQAAKGEPVALVFAKRQGSDEFSAMIHGVYLRGETYQLPGLGAFSVADPRLVLPLQAADLFAYEMYRYAQVYNGPDTPKRPVLENLYAKGLSMYATIHDKNSLASIRPRSPAQGKQPFNGFAEHQFPLVGPQ